MSTTSKQISTDISKNEINESEEKSPLIQALKAFLSKRIDNQYNEVTGQTEVKLKHQTNFSPLSDPFVNDLWIDCSQNKLRVPKAYIQRVLDSSFSNRYNPFNQYLDGLPEWDKNTDYIQQLADTVITTDKPYWDKCLKKFLVALVAALVDDSVINHQVLVLQGQQGVGKSSWLAKLVPNSLKKYYHSGTINLENKDTLIHLSQCMIIHLDELESLNRHKIGVLKEIITKAAISLRKPYGHYTSYMPRRASFVGSVNNPTFLADPTGSRRFLCLEVKQIDYNHSVDMDGVYAQALYLSLNGFKFHFDIEEQREIEAKNQQFTNEYLEDSILLKYFQVATDGTQTDTLTTTEIVEYIGSVTNGKILLNSRSLQHFGKALNRHGFARVKQQGTYKYLVKKLPRMLDFRNANTFEVG